MTETAAATSQQQGVDSGGRKVDFYALLASTYAELAINEARLSTIHKLIGSKNEAPRRDIIHFLESFNECFHLSKVNLRSIYSHDPDALGIIDECEGYLSRIGQHPRSRYAVDLSQRFRQLFIESGMVEIFKEEEFPPFLTPKTILTLRKRREG